MIRAFAYKRLDAIYEESSSGGAFTFLVENFYSSGPGCVYGAVLDDDLIVRHIKVNTLDQCSLFRKSKYVRSDNRYSNISIAKDLEEGKRVLFVGTPCQVNSLLTYLKRQQVNIDKLYTIDLICNGAPSPKVWMDYVNWLETKKKKRLVYFCFREKGDRLNPYLTRATFADGTSVIDKSYTACYNRLFLKKLIISKGCFTCLFKKEERVSDITIGDYWGAETIFDDKRLKDGVSLILLNSEKGENLFNVCNRNHALMQECFNKEYLPFQANLRGVSKLPLKYEIFWKDYNKYGFNYVANKYADANFPRSIKYSLRKISRYLRFILKSLVSR